MPDGVEPFLVYKSSGTKAPAEAPGVILEYFVKGTEPDSYADISSDDDHSGDDEESTSSYLESTDL